MTSRISKTISYIIFGLIGVGLLFFVFKDIDLIEMWDSICKANFRWVAIALVIGLAAHLIRALRWNLLIESVCEEKPSVAHSFWALMFGYFVNLALPRVGEIARCGALTRMNNLPMDKLIGTVIIERVVDVVAVALLGTLLIVTKLDFFGSFIFEKIFGATFSSLPSGATIVMYVAIICVVVCAIVVGFLLIRRSENVITQKISSFIVGIVEGLKSVIKLKKRGRFIFYTLMLWLFYWYMTWFFCFTIPQTTHLSMLDGLFLLIVGSLGQMVPVQAGIGVYHYIVSQALTAYGLAFSEGLLYATISHEAQLIGEIVLGVLSLFVIFKGKKAEV